MTTAVPFCYNGFGAVVCFANHFQAFTGNLDLAFGQLLFGNNACQPAELQVWR